MVVRIAVDRKDVAGVTVLLSPLAELCAALHAFCEAEHHPDSADWVRTVLDVADDGLLEDLRAWAPLWGSQKSRLFYPTAVRGELSLDGELAGLLDLPDAEFSGMVAEAVADGDPSLDYNALTERAQSEKFLVVMRRFSADRSQLAGWLVDDIRTFRKALLTFLGRFAGAVFVPEWQARRPDLLLEAHSRERSLRTRGWRSFEDLGATVEVDPGGVERGHITFDKLSSAMISVRDRPCILIPSWHIGSHIVLKAGVKSPLCVHYSLQSLRRRPPFGAVQHRLAALNDPVRARICRLILRTPKTTLDIARDLGMPESQASRHLRKLRENGLAQARREGRLVFYSLDVEAVSRLGVDFLDALRR